MMNSNKEKENGLDFISCPECQGRGSKGVGLACPQCGGIGTGVFYAGRFFYFKPNLGRAMIELDRFRKNARKAVNYMAFGLGLIGFISLLFWFYKLSDYTVRLEDFSFWSKKSPLLFIFWFSAIADLFVVYSLSREMQKAKAIKVFRYSDFGQEKKLLNKMNNWEEIRKAGSSLTVDVSSALTQQAYAVVENAFMIANRLKHKEADPVHLFYACMVNKEAAAVFSRLDINWEKLTEKLKNILVSKEPATNNTSLSVGIKNAVISAYLDASKWRQPKVDVKNLVYSSVMFDEGVREILLDQDIDTQKIENVLVWLIFNEKQESLFKNFRQQARYKPSSGMDRAYTAVATPFLNNYAYDFTIAAKWGQLEFCVARQDEIGKVWEQFESGANGILLLGPDGVGKRALISGIAQKMVEEDVPPFLIDKRLVELDVARLVSGVTPAEAEGRLMAVVDEVARAGNIVLYISDIENIIGIGSGSEGSMDLSEVLNGAIDRKLLFAFASVSSENYMKYLEGTSLDHSLAKVEVKEPRGNEAIQILEGKVSLIEQRYGVYFSYGAIEKSVLLSSKYMHDSYLPEKAVKILEMAAARMMKRTDDFGIIGAEEIAQIVSEITSVPVTKISENEGKELLNLEKKMHERMVGQDEAVDTVAASLRRARVELRDGDRPIASFLFLGPTGVGKTELAKTIADAYFGNEKCMIRIDMSEYQLADSVKKMIGDIDGTKGFLTEQVRKQPFSLILLDEVEKANPEILNLFLQVMDDGRLTDGQRHVIDFTNSIIIATSNVGASYIQEEIYKGTPAKTIGAELVNNQLNKVMRPELINRFDGIIVFEPLSLGNVVDIARLMLDKVEKMLLGKGIELRVSEDGLRSLAKLGYDPKFGARPLRRIIQDKVENMIANKILAGELRRRDTVVIGDDAKVEVEAGAEL